MTDLYSLRGRALRARLLELVSTAHIQGEADWIIGRGVDACEYAASAVPPVPTRRRTRQFLGVRAGGGTVLYTLSYVGIGELDAHVYRIIGPDLDARMPLKAMLTHFDPTLSETIAECCIDLAANPDEDLE